MSYSFSACYPGESETRSKSQVEFSEIEQVFESFDWNEAFEKASNIYDNLEIEPKYGVPFFEIRKMKNDQILSFTVARNENFENKILTGHSRPIEETSFFGLLKKKTRKNEGKLLNEVGDASKLLTEFHNLEIVDFEALFEK